MKKDRGTIDLPIGRSPRDHTKWLAGDNLPGRTRTAVTQYQTLTRGGEGDKAWSYLALFPETGRTHQLRVHLKALSRPIVCDPIYAASFPSLLNFSRLALHAYSIFWHDVDHKCVSATAPLPSEFTNLL